MAGKRRKKESLVSPAARRLIKSVLYYTFNLAITVVVTVVFTVFNSNPGPASLGTSTILKS